MRPGAVIFSHRRDGSHKPASGGYNVTKWVAHPPGITRSGFEALSVVRFLALMDSIYAPTRLVFMAVGALFALSACQPNRPTPQSPVAKRIATTAPTSVLTIQPVWRGSPRTLQAVVTPIGTDAIDHLVVELWQPEPEIFIASAPVALQNEASGPVIFGNLARNRQYRALGRAYAIDPGSATVLISQDNASSITLNVGPEDATLHATVPIRLQDTEFLGSVSSTGTTIVPGGLSYADQETLVVGP